MTEVAFYHLQSMPLERVLPRLLEKTLEGGNKAVVMAASTERVESLNALLWTYHQDSWLPHGSARDGSPERQPVWLTTKDENPNQARFLFLTDGAVSATVGTFDRCFELFDGRDENAVATARKRWTEYRDAGFELAYWQQSPEGRWERKR